MAVLGDDQTMLYVAGDVNANIGVVEPGDEESIEIFGWGTRNREGRYLVKISRKNGLAVAYRFFQTAQNRVRPNGGAATAAQDGEGLQSVGVRVCHHTAQTGQG